MKWRFFKRFRYRPIGKISAGRLCSCVAKQQESSEASVDGPDDEDDVSNGAAIDVMQEEEVFDWPATPPNELEIDTSELFGESDRSASLARTVDHVVEMFSAVTKRKDDTSSPLPDGSNWRTIQKLVVHNNDKSSGDEEVEEDLEMHISVTVNDSPAFFSADNSLAGSREDIDTTCIRVLDKSSTKKGSSTKLSHSTNLTSCQSPLGSPPPSQSPTGRGAAPRRSKSELTLNTEKRASLKTLNVVKSLNNLVFREEEYDFAAV